MNSQTKKGLVLLISFTVIASIIFSLHVTSPFLQQVLDDVDGKQMSIRGVENDNHDKRHVDDGDGDDDDDWKNDDGNKGDNYEDQNRNVDDTNNEYSKDDDDFLEASNDESEIIEPIQTQKMLDDLQLELNRTKSMIEPIQIAHRATSGLGHRLKWTVSGYHLVKAMNLTNGLFNSWGWECGGKKEDGSTMDIFYYLFGDDVLPVTLPTSPDDPIFAPLFINTIKKIKESPSNPTKLEDVKEMRFINEGPTIYDIPGNKMFDCCLNHSIIDQKTQSDLEMYTRLRKLYRHQNVAQDFARENQYENHFVFGIHIRAGNGEKGHFEDRRRGIFDLEKWLAAFANMMLDFVSTERYTQMAHGKKPLIFVATDTPKSISLLDLAMKDAQTTKGIDVSIPVIHFSQEYMKEGSGVSYAAKFETSDSCYQSWSNQFMDMTLLSASDVVIAGQFSAFTQSMPITIALTSPERKLFCEVGTYGDVMECVDNYFEWLEIHFADKSSSIELIGNATSEKQAFESRITVPLFNHRPSSMRGVNEFIESLFK